MHFAAIMHVACREVHDQRQKGSGAGGGGGGWGGERGRRGGAGQAERRARSAMERLPRPIATMPDCTSSRIPNGSSTRRKASSLSDVPVTSIVTASGATSTTLARNSCTVSSTCERV